MFKIKRYFATGLLITLPIALTLWFLYIAFTFIDGICGKLINYYLKKHLGFSVPGLGFIIGIIIVFGIGFIATNFLGKRVFRALESWFLKLPFIRQIYPAAKQLINSLISKEHRAFKKVVLVQYPSKGIWSVGFLTNDGFKEAEEKSGRELVHVLIGTTPTPLSGFLIMVPRDEIKILDISIEEGIKLIVSGGIVKTKDL